MMYEPKQTEIDDKLQELLDEALLEEDVLVEALIHCLPQVRRLYNSGLFDASDCAFDLYKAIDKHIINYCELEAKAKDALIAERGYTVRTDVDDFKFITHDTRN